MPDNKNIQDAAKAVKKSAAAKSSAASQAKQNMLYTQRANAIAKKAAPPKSSNPVVPKLGAMPKFLVPKAIKNPYAKSSTKSSSGAPKTLPAVTGSKKGVRYAQ